MTASEDPIVLARKERFAAHLPDSDDLSLITLKGHLLIEEILDDIIAFHCRKASVLAETNIPFFLKTRLAHALVGDDSLPMPIWPMIDALRVLRNELAHKLESAKLERAVSKFISLTYGSTENFNKEAPVAQNLRNSMGYMYGYLAGYEHYVRMELFASKGHEA
jgi:hypothetical protein